MRLVDKSRRRYGGYIVHVGIVLMFLGFTGRAWAIDKEVSMVPGQSTSVGEYKLSYEGPRMEVDQTKRMVFADLDVTANGKPVRPLSARPSSSTRSSPNMPTTEVAMMRGFKDDLYSRRRHGQTRDQARHLPIPRQSAGELDLVRRGHGHDLRRRPSRCGRRWSCREVGAWGYVRARQAWPAAVMIAIVLAAMPSTT